MSKIYKQAENEIAIYEEQLANGEITLEEYAKAVRQIEREAREYSR